MKIAIIGLSGQSLFFKVDNFPKEGETISASSIHIEPGGKGYNQAIAAKRLGADCFFLSAIGNDDYGEKCKQLLQKEGVEYNYIKKDTNTSLATILTNASGENKVIVCRGAQLELKDLELFTEKIKIADVLLLQLEIPLIIIEKAIEIAKENNTYVILNPAPFCNLNKDILKKVDLLTPNEGEAKKLFGCNFTNIEKEIKSKNIKSVVVTMGEKGSLLYDNNKVIKIPPYKVDAIDTTGAGDCFNAALAVKIAAKESLFSSCQFASIASALSVKKSYVISGMPYLEEVKKYYKKDI